MTWALCCDHSCHVRLTKGVELSGILWVRVQDRKSALAGVHAVNADVQVLGWIPRSFGFANIPECPLLLMFPVVLVPQNLETIAILRCH